MLYRAIGLMSGSSLDGLDLVLAELQEASGSWEFRIIAADCFPYSNEWKQKLETAVSLNALDYQLLHVTYGHYLGQQVNRFIEENNVHYQAAMIASHGHTTFHLPPQMTAQLGDGASIAAETKLPVITDLRAMDVAFGGQGAPIVPVGEKLLFKDYQLFLNLGGIANISFNLNDTYIAFDVCPANRVLNLLSSKVHKEYDEGGQMAAMGNINEDLLSRLNELSYYKKPVPKSLANNFGTDEVFPLVQSFGLTHTDALRTYTEHIIIQIVNSVKKNYHPDSYREATTNYKLLVTGGGAFNSFLIQRLSQELKLLNIELVLPDETVIQYKEALIMAFIGVLRWRQEYNVLSSVTGASRDSIGGAVWLGSEA